MSNKIKENKFFWSIIAIIATFVAFSIFLDVKLLANYQTNFFSIKSEDCLKDVFNTYYHVKYDTCSIRNNSMNYPYGEHYTYTGCQTFISAPLRTLQDLGFEDLSDNVIPLINLHVLVSIFLCSLFLFLLFKELKLPNIISILGAIFITFLSPQLHRIGGHLTLSYAFIIPALLFLLLKTYNSKRLIYSFLIGFLLIWSGFAHPYYLLFFASLCTIFWGYIFFSEKEKHGGIKRILLSYSIEFLIPVIIFFLITSIGDFDADRTKIPKGIYYYQGRLAGILLPYGHPYFFESPNFFAPIEWGAMAFIGKTAVCVFIGVIVSFFIKLFRKRFSSLLKVTDNNVLNLFFWTSILVLLFSLGFPVNLFPKKFLNYIGPIAQMRALSRYTWLFYYVINVISVYLLYYLSIRVIKKTWLKYALLTVALIFYISDCYFNTKGLKRWLLKEIPEWTDYDNHLEQNKWIARINPDDFQSILALPVYNVGTEQYCKTPVNDMFKKSLYVSMKTGLPMHNNFASRSPIKNSYNNIAFLWEPWTNYPVLKDLKNDKPIMVLKTPHAQTLNEHETRILQYSDSLFSISGISFYSLKIDSLYKLCNDYQKTLQNKYLENKIYRKKDLVFSNDSLQNFYMETWDDQPTNIFIQGGGALKTIISKPNILYDAIIPTGHADALEISFWMSNFTDDLYGRSLLKIEMTDTQNKKISSAENQLVYQVAAIHDGWGLIKTTATLPSNAVNLKITVYNEEMLDKEVYFDNLILRPLDINIISEDKNIHLLNNVIVKF